MEISKCLVTGTLLQVDLSTSLPAMACSACVAIATQALPFIKLSRESQQKWHDISDYLSKMEAGQRESACVLITDDIKMIDYTKRTKSVSTKKQVLRVLRASDELKKALPSHLKCPECNKRHSTVYEMNKHIKDLKLKMCIYCKGLFSIDAFTEHVRISHKAMVYACKFCNKIFRQKRRYIDHASVCKLKYKNRGHVCCMCKKSFPSEFNLIVHCSSKHNPQVCQGCEKKFNSWQCFLYHSKSCVNAKSARDKFICDYCSKEYRIKNALKLHIRFSHTVGWELQCDQCGKKFSNPAHLKEHDNTHNRVEDRYVCMICNAKYSTRRGYERHYKRHFDEQGGLTKYTPRRRQKLFICFICNHAFELKKVLDRHLKSKHDILDWEDPKEMMIKKE